MITSKNVMDDRIFIELSIVVYHWFSVSQLNQLRDRLHKRFSAVVFTNIVQHSYINGEAMLVVTADYDVSPLRDELPNNIGWFVRGFDMALASPGEVEEEW